MNYPSIRIEGQIFSGELLDRLDQPDTVGQRPADFGLPPDVKVKDEIARTWAASQSYYRVFRQKTGKEAPSLQAASLTTETRNLWLIPFLSLLGYKPDYARKGEEINGKIYPISHRDDARDHLPIHLLGWNDSLDKRREDGSGPRMSPHALLQEYLNLSEHLYGIVANGHVLRLLRDSTRLVRQSFIEFDLERMFEEDLFADFAVMFRLLQATRLPASQAAAPASLVEKYHQDALDQGSRIREGLRDAVEQVLVMLGTGFLADDTIRKRMEGQPDPAQALSPKEYYHCLLRLVYRLLFLLVAEERGLIFPASASRNQRDIYNRHYSVSRLRRLAPRYHLFEKEHTDLWQGLLATFRLFEFGGPGAKLGISPLGGHLFSAEALGPLVGARLPNPILLQVFDKLCYFTHNHGAKTTVNYGALATEEFGSVYESLLELNPVVAGTTFSFSQVAGNERKTSGSYYTPDSLVQCLLDSALDPVVADAIKCKSDEAAATAILQLKVCDPAAGSGHFILGAARRMARRLALIRAHGDEPSPALYRTSLRDVISHCLYAVDINPMAVELCKINLWLDAMEPGKPLSFLDHHIRVGNSLLGTTPELVAAGLPDTAFEPIEGDDKKACAALRKRNKGEREGIGGLFVKEDQFNAAALQQAVSALEELPDDRPEDIVRKEQAFRQNEQAYDFQARKRLFDTWCAAFVTPKVFKEGGTEPVGITQRHLTDLSQGRGLPPELGVQVEQLIEAYAFFHWALVFPEVFGNGGFDVVLGNPPWEKINLKDEEYFANSHPHIAEAPSKAVRKSMIERLKQEEPASYTRYVEAKEMHDRTSVFFRFSGCYPLTGVSRINLYSVFCETGLRLLASRGRLGMVLASGIATDDNSKILLAALIEGKRLVHAWDFENREAIFPDVDSRYKFCLFCAGGTGLQQKEADFAFYLTNVQQLSEAERHFALSGHELALLNPNTRTCPSFRNKREAEITKIIYHRVPAWELHEKSCVWPGTPKTPFNMSNDSGLFIESAKLQELGDRASELVPLYESKFIFQFNHRFATCNENVEDGTTELGLTQLQDPDCSVASRYWLPHSMLNERFPGRWFFGYRMITNATNERAAVAAVVPERPCAHSLSIVEELNASGAAVLLGCVNSFVYDYTARQKIAGTNFSHWIWRQLPIMAAKQVATACPWFTESITVRDWVLPRVLELTYTAWDLEPFAVDCGYGGPPFRWDDDRRFWLRAELDAAFFHLYLGTPEEWAKEPPALCDSFPTPRDAVAYIMDTFPIVRRKDEEKYGTYRTKDAILDIYDAMAEAIRTRKPYQTRLDPPPGPPAGGLPDWKPGQPRPANWPEHVHPPKVCKA